MFSDFVVLKAYLSIVPSFTAQLIINESTILKFDNNKIH